MSFESYKRNTIFSNSEKETHFSKKETHAKTAADLQKVMQTVKSFAGYKKEEADICEKALSWLSKSFDKCQASYNLKFHKPSQSEQLIHEKPEQQAPAPTSTPQHRHSPKQGM